MLITITLLLECYWILFSRYCDACPGLLLLRWCVFSASSKVLGFVSGLAEKPNEQTRDFNM